MIHSDWTEADSRKSKHIWEAYQEQYDLSEHVGQTVGIDPKRNRIWFGDSIQEIVQQRDREGLESPLFFQRVGDETYFRKVGHKWFTCDIRTDFIKEKQL